MFSEKRRMRAMFNRQDEFFMVCFLMKLNNSVISGDCKRESVNTLKNRMTEIPEITNLEI